MPRRLSFLWALRPRSLPLMVYIETSFESGIRHISELAGRIHGHGDRACSCRNRPCRC